MKGNSLKKETIQSKNLKSNKEKFLDLVSKEEQNTIDRAKQRITKRNNMSNTKNQFKILNDNILKTKRAMEKYNNEFNILVIKMFDDLTKKHLKPCTSPKLKIFKGGHGEYYLNLPDTQYTDEIENKTEAFQNEFDELISGLGFEYRFMVGNFDSLNANYYTLIKEIDLWN